MSISQQIPDHIKSVSRCVGYALWLSDIDALSGLSAVLTARLSAKDRGALAWAVLRALTPEQIIEVA
ncbi:hypothetical protein, partial [Thioclava dalianensis]|uniref:hypothetical protein n=1 Tax=Thioclava dalianensis TaxID=1185766 RepID=UPI001B8085E8